MRYLKKKKRVDMLVDRNSIMMSVSAVDTLPNHALGSGLRQEMVKVAQYPGSSSKQLTISLTDSIPPSILHMLANVCHLLATHDMATHDILAVEAKCRLCRQIPNMFSHAVNPMALKYAVLSAVLCRLRPRAHNFRCRTQHFANPESYRGAGFLATSPWTIGRIRAAGTCA